MNCNLKAFSFHFTDKNETKYHRNLDKSLFKLKCIFLSFLSQFSSEVFAKEKFSSFRHKLFNISEDEERSSKKTSIHKSELDEFLSGKILQNKRSRGWQRDIKNLGIFAQSFTPTLKAINFPAEILVFLEFRFKSDENQQSIVDPLISFHSRTYLTHNFCSTD